MTNIYFVERKDGLIHGSQACPNPPIDDNLRSREVAAEIHGGSPDDWQGRMVEVEPLPGQYIESIAADGKGGYVVNQKPVPPPPPPSIKEQLAATDAGMIRIIEDILTALVVKKLILKTDIPQAVLDKISAREALRSQLK